MKNLPIEKAPQWQLYRMLNFLNEVQSPDEIVQTVLDDPENGPGTAIGLTVASRILRKRQSLPRRRFTDPEELVGIKGLGADKFQDLLFTFNQSAAEAFRTNMYENGVIYESNWPLEHYTFFFRSKEGFLEIVQEEEAFRQYVADQFRQICLEKQQIAELCQNAVDQIRQTYLDVYTNSTEEAAYALALWFYRFDADNWFSFDQVRQECAAYFSFYTDYPWEMELYFFKGVQQGLLLPGGISPVDLPVVVNYPEQSITLWSSTLFD